MSEPLPIEESVYTYADYLKWNDGKRYELIDGRAYMMTSPSTAHQIISGELFGQFWNFLGGKTCRVCSASYDVRLFPKKISAMIRLSSLICWSFATRLNLTKALAMALRI